MNIKKQTALVIVATMVALAFPRGEEARAAHTSPGPIFVDSGTCPGPGDGSVGDPFCAVQDAVNHATSGDVIEVVAGAYPERLTTDKSVELRGAQFGADPNMR